MNTGHEILMQTPAGFYEEHDDEAVHVVTSGRVVDSLCQDNSFKRRANTLEVVDAKRLNTTVQRGRRVKRYAMSLCLVNPVPVHKVVINWHLIVTALIVFSMVVGLLWTEWSVHLSSHSAYFYSMVISLTAVTTIMALVAIYQYKNVYVYSSAHGGVELFEIDKNVPSKSEVGAFMARLKEHVAQAQHPGQAGILAVAVKEHRQLVEQGVISDIEYDQAKKRIFASLG